MCEGISCIIRTRPVGIDVMMSKTHTVLNCSIRMEPVYTLFNTLLLFHLKHVLSVKLDFVMLGLCYCSFIKKNITLTKKVYYRKFCISAGNRVDGTVSVCTGRHGAQSSRQLRNIFFISLQATRGS